MFPAAFTVNMFYEKVNKTFLIIFFGGGQYLK